MKQQIKHRYSDKVLFECELADGTVNPLREAVIKAVASRANLTRADLSEADLTRANLTEADLSRANLTRANLTRANLTRADLSEADLSEADLSEADLSEADLSRANLTRANLSEADLSEADLSEADLSRADLSEATTNPIKADFWMVLLSATPEIAGLRLALTEGRVDGSTYQGDCACLVGTIANVRKAGYQEIGIKPDSSRAAERWFMGIKKGDTPETNQVSKLTVEWLDEFVGKLNIAKVAV